MLDPLHPVGPCCLCGGNAEIYRLRQTIAGEKRAVCRACAETGNDVFGRDPAARSALGCLHLTALEIERALDRDPSGLYQREIRALSGIRARFKASAFRAECGCLRCSPGAVVEPASGQSEVARIVAEVHARTVQDASGQPDLALLRSMPGGARVAGPDGSMLAPDDAVDAWRAHNHTVTARPAASPGALSERAAARISAPYSERPEVRAKRQSVADERARRHWLMVKKYGSGVRDGDFWVTRDGCVIPLDAADRVQPMTEADKLALQNDQRRARRWQSEEVARRLSVPELPPGGLSYDDHLQGVAEWLRTKCDDVEGYLRQVTPAAAVRLREILGGDGD